MINKQRLGETFQALAAIDSVSRTEGRISNEIRKMLEPLGGAVFIDDAGGRIGSDTGNLIIKFSGTRQAPPLMLNAHMDTVEPGNGVKPQFADGIFKSDGTTVLGADDKSAVAIIIETMRAIHENSLEHGPLELVFTICEEIGLLGAKYLDEKMISAKFGYSLDTSDTETIITQAPASNRFDLTVHGKAAHAGAEPEKGINAISVASRAIAGLEMGRIDLDTTANIGAIQCDGATNIVPEQVRVRGEIRSHSPETLKRVSDGIITAFEAAAAGFETRDEQAGLPRIEVDMEEMFPATSIPEQHPVIQHARAAADRLGRQLTAKRTGGGSDANIFFNKGIVTGVLGTGMQEVHTVREWIRLEDMARTAALLLEIIGLHASGEQGR
ncbi:MAG: M20/M25/M40 family metallo-hydrolase [Desulfobacteraceae bacterium]|nr:M20/M25/M40 family metallo-hydrolase [Desulfobacteraceae bacterium]